MELLKRGTGFVLLACKSRSHWKMLIAHTLLEAGCFSSVSIVI
jgi:hypothetical protein